MVALKELECAYHPKETISFFSTFLPVSAYYYPTSLLVQGSADASRVPFEREERCERTKLSFDAKGLEVMVQYVCFVMKW